MQKAEEGDQNAILMQSTELGHHIQRFNFKNGL